MFHYFCFRKSDRVDWFASEHSLQCCRRGEKDAETRRR